MQKFSEFVKTQKQMESNLDERVRSTFGWEGERYNKNLVVADVVKLTKKYIKDNYPKCKFSITVDKYKSVTISLLEGDFDAFEYGSQKYYKLKERDITTERFLTDECIAVLNDVYEYIDSYRVDRSKPQVDYYYNNFHISTIEIGTPSKPYINTNK